jgi:hypothetical protein
LPTRRNEAQRDATGRNKAQQGATRHNKAQQGATRRSGSNPLRHPVAPLGAGVVGAHGSVSIIVIYNDL